MAVAWHKSNPSGQPVSISASLQRAEGVWSKASVQCLGTISFPTAAVCGLTATLSAVSSLKSPFGILSISKLRTPKGSRSS